MIFSIWIYLINFLQESAPKHNLKNDKNDRPLKPNATGTAYGRGGGPLSPMDSPYTRPHSVLSSTQKSRHSRASSKRKRKHSQCDEEVQQIQTHSKTNKRTINASSSRTHSNNTTKIPKNDDDDDDVEGGGAENRYRPSKEEIAEAKKIVDLVSVETEGLQIAEKKGNRGNRYYACPFCAYMCLKPGTPAKLVEHYKLGQERTNGKNGKSEGCRKYERMKALFTEHGCTIKPVDDFKPELMTINGTHIKNAAQRNGDFLKYVVDVAVENDFFYDRRVRALRVAFGRAHDGNKNDKWYESC